MPGEVEWKSVKWWWLEPGTIINWREKDRTCLLIDGPCRGGHLSPDSSNTNASNVTRGSWWKVQLSGWRKQLRWITQNLVYSVAGSGLLCTEGRRMFILFYVSCAQLGGYTTL